MTSTKRLKHISMMLHYEDVEYVETKLCNSHGDLSHIFRNVFHNFVEGLKAQERTNKAKLKKESSLSTNKGVNNGDNSSKSEKPKKPKKQASNKTIRAKK